MRIILTCLLIASVLVTCDSSGYCENVRMVERSQWGKRKSNVNFALLHSPVSRLLIHHVDAGTCAGRTQCDDLVRRTHNILSAYTGYNNLIFNFLISPDGYVYEGAGWTRMASATPQYNMNTVGVAFIGTFETATPTAASLRAVKDLFDCGIRAGKLRPNFRIQGDNSVENINGPGRQLLNTIKTWPEYS